MPPNSRLIGPAAVRAVAIRSCSSMMPSAISTLAPTSAATAMSIRSKAITRITTENTPTTR